MCDPQGLDQPVGRGRGQQLVVDMVIAERDAEDRARLGTGGVQLSVLYIHVLHTNKLLVILKRTLHKPICD